ncbi:histidine kinase dimerization/phospho-acceptor domain-containing protein, partial [Halobium palmae]
MSRGGGERRDDTTGTIVETVPIGVTTIDETGTIRWANQVYADTLGIPREELTGTAYSELVAAGYYETAAVERYLDVVRSLLSSSAPDDHRSYLVRTRLPDGETLVHDVSTALLPFDDGEFRGTVNAFRDVTTQKAYERELDRQNERLEEFASVVSHDLRNPLNIAMGYVDLALETGDREALLEVKRAHERMETLIDDLLSLAVDGQHVRESQPTDVETVVRRAWRSVETGDGALVVVDGLDGVDADPSRLQQLFENLFRNSIEHGSTE